MQSVITDLVLTISPAESNLHENPQNRCYRTPPNQVAQILRVPEATLRYWIHKETGPTNLKIGRHIRYPRAALQRWMREQRRGGGRHDVA